MMANQISVIGPNHRETLPVPRTWMANRPIRMAVVSGSTKRPKLGEASSSPSTADSTEMAGVMMASP